MDEPVEAPGVAHDAPLKSVLTELYDDGRAYVSAQVDVMRIVGKAKARALGLILALVMVALVLAFGALLSLLIGLILVLQPLWGTGWSVVAVVAGALLLAAALGWLAYARLQGLFGR
jgi:Putative Actinobacterial Holin-X, holin superfamily III